MSKITLFLVDCVALERDRIARELRLVTDVDLVTAASFDEAKHLVKRPDAVILGVQANDAVEQIRRARGRFESSTIVVAGYLPSTCAFAAARAGADALLLKPITGNAILAVLGGQPGATSSQPTRLSLARAEWEYMHAVLTECRGNRSETARQLGIRRFVLQRKLSKPPPTP